jgi:hypothetical protein
MIRIALLVLGLSTFAAQTPPPPTLQWNAPSNTADAVEAQSLIYTLYVNGGTGIVVTGVTCTGVVPSNCSAPLPAGIPTAIGTRLEITAKTATTSESPRSLPFISPPNAPTNLRRQ